MKVFKPGSRGRHNLFVQPGNVHKNTDFVDADGKAKLITVTFKEGAAEVPDNLGRYLLDNNMASSSPIILL